MYASDKGGLRITRSVGEDLVIGQDNDEVVVVIEAAAGGRVQLRIVAQKHVKIMRAELLGQSQTGEGK